MKKFIALLVAVAMTFIMSVSLSAPAVADADNKKVTLCHATGSEKNPYEKIEVSVSAFYVGHADHEGDIWEAFSYTDKKGDVVNVPAQGDTSLLAFPDCAKPVIDEPIVVPAAQYADPCGTENDVFSVPAGLGYSVGPVVVDGDTQSITVTALDGFTFPGGKTVTITKPAFTNVDCDLPETGAKVTNVVGGLIVLGLIAAGIIFLLRRRS